MHPGSVAALGGICFELISACYVEIRCRRAVASTAGTAEPAVAPWPTATAKKERPGPRASNPAAGRVDQRAAAVELVVRLERLTVTTQQELAVARLQLAQLEATKQSQAATAGSPAAQQQQQVQQLAQLLHSVQAQVQQLRAEMNTLKSTASTPASASPTPP